MEARGRVTLAVALAVAITMIGGFWEAGGGLALMDALSAPPPAVAAASKIGYPQKGKAIKIIVPWPAGNANDLLARLLAGEMEKELGTPVVVEDKPGASTQLGMTELVRAKPDGYTLAVTSTMTTSLTYLDAERKAIFSRADFQPVAVAIMEPMCIAVRGNSPYKTTKDLVEAARAAPKKITLAGTGRMTPTHLVSLMLEKSAGVQFTLVHFEGSPQALAALMGGHVDAVMGGTGPALGPHKGGEIRVLGLTNRAGSPFFPDVKTLPAQGYNVVMELSRGIAAPRGVRSEIVEALSEVTRKATSNEEFRKKMTAMVMGIRFMDSKEYTAHWDETDAETKPLLAEIKAAIVERATPK